MKNKLIPYGVFFIVASLYALYVSQSSSSKTEVGQDWDMVPKGSIVRLFYEGEGQKVSIQKDQSLPRYWVEVNSTTSPEQNGKAIIDRFLAQDSIQSLFDGFSPLRAAKVLGKAEGLKLEDFGLDKSNQQLTLEFGSGKSLTLKFGKRSFQSSEVFVLDVAKNSVFMLDRQFLSPLDKPKARLALSQPYQFKSEDVKSVSLMQSTKTTEYFVQVKGDVRQWFKKEKKDAADESFKNWLDKFLKLKIEGYPTSEDQKAIDQATVKVSLSIFGEKEKLDVLSLLELKGESGTQFWLKADSLPVPVLIESSKAGLLLNDLSNL